MAVERHIVRLVRSNESVEAEFVLDKAESGDRAFLTLHCFGREFVGNAPDYFDSMCEIRNEIEALGWRPDCYGASRNVHPSGMCRDTGKFVAIDVDCADFEVHEDDLTAVRRLKARRPSARAFLCRAGHAAAYKTGLRGGFEPRQK